MVEDPPAHLRLWQAVAARCPQGCVVPPMTLAAFAGHLIGKGALACALAERATGIQPGYTLGRLLLDLLAQGVDPPAHTRHTLRAVASASGKSCWVCRSARP